MTLIVVDRESLTTDARLMIPTVQLRDDRQVVAGANQPLIVRSDTIQSVIDGITFYAYKVYNAANPLQPGASIDFVVTTAVGRRIGIGIKAECGGNAEVYVYENVTDVVGGTLYVPFNRNRASTTIAQTGVILQPTSVTAGTEIYAELVLGGTGGTAAGAVAEADYALLKADTSYLFRMTNTTSQAHIAEFAVQWVENG